MFILGCCTRAPAALEEEETVGATSQLIVGAGHVIRDDFSTLGHVYFHASSIAVFSIKKDRLRPRWKARRYILLGEQDGEQRQHVIAFVERRCGAWVPLPPLRLRILGTGKASLPFNGALMEAMDVARRQL